MITEKAPMVCVDMLNNCRLKPSHSVGRPLDSILLSLRNRFSKTGNV